MIMRFVPFCLQVLESYILQKWRQDRIKQYKEAVDENNDNFDHFWWNI